MWLRSDLRVSQHSLWQQNSQSHYIRVWFISSERDTSPLKAFHLYLVLYFTNILFVQSCLFKSINTDTQNMYVFIWGNIYQPLWTHNSLFVQTMRDVECLKKCPLKVSLCVSMCVGEWREGGGSSLWGQETSAPLHHKAVWLRAHVHTHNTGIPPTVT